MIRLLRRIFGCTHEYKDWSPTARSERRGNDNHVITSTYHECSRCGDSYTKIIDVKVEKDYYIS